MTKKHESRNRLIIALVVLLIGILIGIVIACYFHLCCLLFANIFPGVCAAGGGAVGGGLSGGVTGTCSDGSHCTCDCPGAGTPGGGYCSLGTVCGAGDTCVGGSSGGCPTCPETPIVNCQNYCLGMDPKYYPWTTGVSTNDELSCRGAQAYDCNILQQQGYFQWYSENGCCCYYCYGY